MAPRRVPVKLRPDVYCSKIVDINRVGRKVVKVIRLKKEDMIKYEKVKERPPASPAVEEVELEATSSDLGEAAVIFKDMQEDNCHVEEGVNDVVDFDKNNLDAVVKSECDEQEKCLPSEYEETVSSNSSLALVLTDSEIDDDDYDDAHENDIVCNLVEAVSPKDLIPRRVLLSRSKPRREKIKFGFSKFEFKNSTQNLDRFFVPKPRLKVKFKRQRISFQTNGKDPVMKGSEVKDLKEVKAICDTSEKVLVDLEDLTSDTNQGEEILAQDESFKLLSDEQSIGEYEFGKDKYEETNVNVDDCSVDASFTREMKEVSTSDNLGIGEEQDVFCTDLDETEVSNSAGIIDDPADEFDNLFVEEGIVSKPEMVQVFDKEVSIEKSYAMVTDGVQTVLDFDFVYHDIDEFNKASEDKVNDEAALEVFLKEGKDFDTLEPVVKHNLKEDHSPILLYKNDPKPNDGQEIPLSPTAVDLLPRTQACEAGRVQDCLTVLPETALSTELVLESTETVGLLQSTKVLPETELSTENDLDRGTAPDTKEEVDKLQPCMAAWTLTARQVREESLVTSCLAISQVEPSIPLCGESFLNTSAPGPVFGAATQSSSKASPETRKLSPNPSCPIQDTPAEAPPQDNISELLTPSCVQLQSYLSDAVVSDVDLEVLASLGTSPDVIITEVPHVARDMENNVIDEEKLEKTSDDSDSDVVLLSDDETELCSPSPSLTIISSWQLDILSQTWQAWPVPTKDILLHLGLETGLSDSTIRDWFKKRTDQELVRVWGELENM